MKDSKTGRELSRAAERYCLVCDRAVDGDICSTCSSETFAHDDEEVRAFFEKMAEQRRTKWEGRAILVSAFVVGIPVFALVQLLGFYLPALGLLFNDYTSVIFAAAAAYGVTRLPERWRSLGAWRKRRRLLKSELNGED